MLCPHPRAKKCTIEAARIVRDAAVAAGAPEGERCAGGRCCMGRYCPLAQCAVSLGQPPFSTTVCASLRHSITCSPPPLSLLRAPPTPPPPDIISWIEQPSLLVSQALMQSRDVSLILATGGPQMVRAAGLLLPMHVPCAVLQACSTEPLIKPWVRQAYGVIPCLTACPSPPTHHRRCAPPTPRATPLWVWAPATRRQ